MFEKVVLIANRQILGCPQKYISLEREFNSLHNMIFKKIFQILYYIISLQISHNNNAPIFLLNTSN